MSPYNCCIIRKHPQQISTPSEAFDRSRLQERLRAFKMGNNHVIPQDALQNGLDYFDVYDQLHLLGKISCINKRYHCFIQYENCDVWYLLAKKLCACHVCFHDSEAMLYAYIYDMNHDQLIHEIKRVSYDVLGDGMKAMSPMAKLYSFKDFPDERISFSDHEIYETPTHGNFSPKATPSSHQDDGKRASNRPSVGNSPIPYNGARNSFKTSPELFNDMSLLDISDMRSSFIDMQYKKDKNQYRRVFINHEKILFWRSMCRSFLGQRR